MNLKENSFITAIGLLPFILLLGILKIKKVLEGSFYGYLLLLVISVFIISFIFSLFYVLDDIKKSKSKKSLILLILFPLIYLPIYYTKYVYKNEKMMGYSISIMNIMLIASFFFATKSFVHDYMNERYHRDFKVVDSFRYSDKNQLFTITIDNNYICQNDLGDYVIACDNKKDDSFMGIYSYQRKSFSDGALDDIKEYHIEQTIDFIKEKGLDAEINKVNDLTLITYSNMVVCLKQIVYEIDNNSYCLMIIKEVNQNDFDIIDFEKSIEKIFFLV